MPNALTFSARGVDYPGVTKVIQVGAPSSRDIYIHRIGRTGRAGKNGDATLILAPFEEGFLNKLHGIPIKDHELPESELELGKKEQKVFDVAQKVVPEGMIDETFASMLGYCTCSLDVVDLDLPKTKEMGVTTQRTMSEMENWALAMGAPAVPHVSETLLARIIGNRGIRDRRGSDEGGRGFDRGGRGFDRGGRGFDGGGREFDRGGRGGFDGAERQSRGKPWEDRGRRGSR